MLTFIYHQTVSYSRKNSAEEQENYNENYLQSRKRKSLGLLNGRGVDIRTVVANKLFV